jgi:hypothetical protein
MSHLNVGDVATWYARHYPGFEVGSLVPGTCFYCWQELTEGDDVVIRGRIGGETPVAPGTHGRLMAVLSSPEDEAIYHVQLANGDERYFVRGELRKCQEDNGPRR